MIKLVRTRIREWREVQTDSQEKSYPAIARWVIDR